VTEVRDGSGSLLAAGYPAVGKSSALRGAAGSAMSSFETENPLRSDGDQSPAASESFETESQDAQNPPPQGDSSPGVGWASQKNRELEFTNIDVELGTMETYLHEDSGDENFEREEDEPLVELESVARAYQGICQPLMSTRPRLPFLPCSLAPSHADTPAARAAGIMAHPHPRAKLEGYLHEHDEFVVTDIFVQPEDRKKKKEKKKQLKKLSKLSRAEDEGKLLLTTEVRGLSPLVCVLLAAA
jgi:hypothetical protein